MAKRFKRNANVLPDPGDVFLMSLEDGRFGVCRVIQKNALVFGEERVLVATTPWIGSSEPKLSEPMLRNVLMLNHHKWQNSPSILWISDPVPSDFKLIGFLEPSSIEEQLTCNVLGAWASLPLTVLLQWRWDNDRDAVLREDEVRYQEEEMRQEAEKHRRKVYLSKIKLEDIRHKQRFEKWEGFVSNDALDAARNIFRETIDTIIDLGTDASEESILERLKWCIESLNKLDARHNWFIETEEREEICIEFKEIVHASGLGHYRNLADKWREW